MEWTSVVKILGTLLALSGLLLACRLARARFDGPRPAFWKAAAFVGLVVLPAAAVGVANYHTFEGSHTVEAGCGSCHVMRPMLTDMHSQDSGSLAARHHKNGWIPRDACYACHADYGFAGDVAARLEGFRHLARYTSGTYEEPIVARSTFDNQNCLKCHEGVRAFEQVADHQTVRALLEPSKMSCLNCHGPAHPPRQLRTPGHPDYARLMTPKPDWKLAAREATP